MFYLCSGRRFIFPASGAGQGSLRRIPRGRAWTTGGMGTGRGRHRTAAHRRRRPPDSGPWRRRWRSSDRRRPPQKGRLQSRPPPAPPPPTPPPPAPAPPRRPNRRALGRRHGHDFLVEYVGQDLAPQGTPRSAARAPNLLNPHTHVLHDLEDVPQPHGDPLQYRPDEVAPLVPQREAHERPARVRIGVWGPLSREVRQEDHALLPRRPPPARGR